jgi:surface polysaccharide O-acyltransferase-like enzyme
MWLRFASQVRRAGCLLWTITAVPLRQRLQPAVLSVSRLTFGIYLVHPFVMDYVLLVFKPDSVKALAVIFGLTPGRSALLAALSHRSCVLVEILG